MTCWVNWGDFIVEIMVQHQAAHVFGVAYSSWYVVLFMKSLEHMKKCQNRLGSKVGFCPFSEFS